MGRLLGLTIAVAAAAATVAVAAPPATPGKTAAPHLFLSPSGEPFRQSPSVPDPMKAWFEQVDTAHKGYIDRAEFRADAAHFFKQLDENGDGIIDGFEVADYEAKIVPELAEAAEGRLPGQFGPVAGHHGQGGDGPGRRHGRGGSGGGHGQQDRDQDEASASQGDQPQNGRGHAPQRPITQLIDEPEPVSGADFALDSHITFAEWMRATDQRFEILDANKDGHITLDELKARFLPIKR